MTYRERTIQRLYGVTYRDIEGGVRHVRVRADTGEDAADHVARIVVGYSRLERVSEVRNDPFQSKAGAR